MNITTHLLLLGLFSMPPFGGLGDLCDIVNPATGAPIRCNLHPEGAPFFEEPVCCDAGYCYAWDGRLCPDGLPPYYCELGEAFAWIRVGCDFEVPNYCDLSPREPGEQAQAQSFPMCCNQGICWRYDGPGDCELTELSWCFDGVRNADGNVTCFD